MASQMLQKSTTSVDESHDVGSDARRRHTYVATSGVYTTSTENSYNVGSTSCFSQRCECYVTSQDIQQMIL